MPHRRAPDARATKMLDEAISYAIAMRLIGTALVTLKNERGEAVHAIAWQISSRLEKLRRILKRRDRIS